MRTLLRLATILTPLSANYVCPFLQLWFLDRISVNLAAKTVAEICTGECHSPLRTRSPRTIPFHSTGEWPFAPTDPNALLSA